MAEYSFCYIKYVEMGQTSCYIMFCKSAAKSVTEFILALYCPAYSLIN